MAATLDVPRDGARNVGVDHRPDVPAPTAPALPLEIGASAPDHVPEGLLAEHPDAAAVVGRGRDPSAPWASPPSTPTRRRPVGPLLGLVACAAIAALGAWTAGSGGDGAARPGGEEQSAVTATAGPTEAPACGTSAVVRCGAPCPPLTALPVAPGCDPAGLRTTA